MANRLPAECWEEIFENLDIGSLHTAILIDRRTFSAGIRKLWSNPFEVFEISKSKKIWKILNVYLSYLSQETKDFLLGFSIDIDELSIKKPIFPYVTLLKTFHLANVDRAIALWMDKRKYYFFDDDNVRIANTILRELVIVFLNQSNLTNICAEKSFCTDEQRFDSFFISFARLPNVQSGLSNLSSFHCEGCLPSEFYLALAEICHSITDIRIKCGCVDSVGLNALIKAQEKGLVSFSLDASTDMPLLMKAFSNKYDTLKNLTSLGRYRVPLTAFRESPLESLIIKSYERVRKDYFEPLMTNPVQNLWKLEIDLVGLQIESLITIIENSGSTLQVIHLKWQYVIDGYNAPTLFTSIANNCTKLNSLNIAVNSKTVLQLHEITRSNPLIKSLTLRGDTMPGHRIDISEGIIQLANSESFPKKLELLQLNYDVMIKNSDALDIFFSNAKTFLIKPLKFQITDGFVGNNLIHKSSDYFLKYGDILEKDSIFWGIEG
ncbi:3664_t:CDS:1 [Funneliformis mosseae]|uniref:3664_t:CDS:1 n=1 Tax=Funneliformis mosseae TaxID=27381 RepID=A0A9N9DII8_FUNMO|nr:3664_t:CDS:1 [Funneliformis mosseae]